MTHPLLDPPIVTAIERAASAHRGRQWRAQAFTDRGARAAHPAGILHGTPFSVFAKLSQDIEFGREQFTAELDGLELITRLAAVRTPTPVATGLVSAGTGWLLMFEALPERISEARTPKDFAGIGHTLATLHQVTAERFGAAGRSGFFGPLPQDNRPVPSNRWADFYAERRVRPMLRLAVNSGNLPAECRRAAGSDRLRGVSGDQADRRRIRRTARAVASVQLPGGDRGGRTEPLWPAVRCPAGRCARPER
ncbi:MAG TPA: fructosamine kinase family protein [Streptosporangiaceae bacterium]|nr:fructosamine kinase family protein [Streptosporangiaceae bacterium]